MVARPWNPEVFLKKKRVASVSIPDRFLLWGVHELQYWYDFKSLASFLVCTIWLPWPCREGGSAQWSLQAALGWFAWYTKTRWYHSIGWYESQVYMQSQSSFSLTKSNLINLPGLELVIGSCLLLSLEPYYSK